jgi:hypothetical protein
MLLLHEPHANVYSATDQSKAKVLQAARIVMESIYSLTATSYDPTLLPKQCVGYWAATGRFLCRMYLACLKQNHLEDAMVIRNEIDVIRLAICTVSLTDPIPVLATESHAP